MYCGLTVRPRAKVTESIQKVLNEKSSGTKMNDLDLFVYRSLKVTRTIASHSPLNISQTVRDRGLVPKVHQ